ncbi:MAG: glycosyltransferase [Bacteroidetes bacterium]|nr:glycosyltransferase [Bacteroidota bacterium]
MIPAEAPALEKIRHYRRIGRAFQAQLDAHPDAPVVWTSISPEPAGHWRDLMTIFPRIRSRTVVAVVHWGKFAEVFSHPGTRFSARRRIPALFRTVFTAQVLSDACAPWIPERRRAVIPNTLDAAMIPDADTVARRRAAGPPVRPRILFVANMLPQKGWPDVLEATARLQADGLRADWVFAGAWPDEATRAAFHAQVDQHGLSDCVTHLGAVVDRGVLAAEYLAADLFVLPSWLREAQPLTIMEAMAAGVPCVVADDGGMPDLIGASDPHPAGVAVPVRQPDRLAEDIRGVLEPGAWARASAAARTRFEERFAPQSVSRQWGRLLDEAMEAAP